ncbi:MAG: hypothetical protein ACT4QD_00160 [Acidobacteriota bacterium]
MTDEARPERLLDPVKRLYEQSLREHGAVAKAVGWKDEASHRLRFEKLAQVIDRTDQGFSVTDLGCGYGAMFDYLWARFPALERYIGIDVREDMPVTARARVDDGRSFVSRTDGVA